MFQRGRTRFISFLLHRTRPFLLLCPLFHSLSFSLRAFFLLVEIVAYTHAHTHIIYTRGNGGGRRGDTRARN